MRRLAKRIKATSAKIDCLFHTKAACICVTAVTTDEQLQQRFRNQAALAKFGIEVRR